MRLLRASAAVVAVVATFFTVFVASANAAPAEPGQWRAYGNTNPITSSSSAWACGQTYAVTSDELVKAQVCAVRAPNGLGVQAAVVVRNNRSSLYALNATAHLFGYESRNRLGTWNCPSSGVAANSWSVCFGQTISFSPEADASGVAGGISLGYSLPI